MVFDRVHIQLTSPDLSDRLTALNRMGITLEGIQQKDLLTAGFFLSGKDYPRAKKYLQARGDEIQLLSLTGPTQLISGWLHRPVLVLTFALLLFLTLWLPTRVLFIRVEGNEKIPTQQILECAQESGIRFGQNVRQVRSERVKNALLEKIPQLQWVGVNTQGCVATISVTEGVIPSAQEQQPMEISSLVASRDAVIMELVATQGNKLCKVGDVVQKGQVLISGFTDCGIKIQAVQAKGEVYGKTIYEKTLIFPTDHQKKGEKISTNQNIFLQIGKKEIKIWKGSGISGTICDKMYARKYLTLPGGFQLPVALTVEITTAYESGAGFPELSVAQPIMERAVRADLSLRMISGQILSAQESVGEYEGYYRLSGRYVCREMIARIHQEEIGTNYEQNDRKSRKR